MPLMLALALLGATKTPLRDAIQAWALSRKLSLESTGKNVRVKATNGHCYHGVTIELAGRTAKATGKDGPECAETERFEMVGFERKEEPTLWLVAFDSVFSSTIGAYDMQSGKLVLDQDMTARLPSADTMLPAALRSLAPHYHLDEKGVRAEIDRKELRRVCGTMKTPPEPCKAAAPPIVVVRWDADDGRFVEDKVATQKAVDAAIAAAAAVIEPPPKKETEELEEGPRRVPLK